MNIGKNISLKEIIIKIEAESKINSILNDNKLTPYKKDIIDNFIPLEAIELISNIKYAK